MKVTVSRWSESREEKGGVLRKLRQVRTFGFDIRVSGMSQGETEVIQAYQEELGNGTRVRLKFLEDQGGITRRDNLTIEIQQKSLPDYHLKVSSSDPVRVEEAIKEVGELLEQTIEGVRLVAAYTGREVVEREL